MTPIRKILVPVDFSASSEAALRSAAEIAGRFEAQIDVLHVWVPPIAGDAELSHVPSQQLWRFAHTDAGEAMKGYLTALEQWGIDARGRLEPGDPSTTIVEAASEGDYDLVVVGTHAQHGLGHWLFGGTAETVVRHARCPVLTVRNDETSVPSRRRRSLEAEVREVGEAAR